MRPQMKEIQSELMTFAISGNALGVFVKRYDREMMTHFWSFRKHMVR
jgi:hypothetical protein